MNSDYLLHLQRATDQAAECLVSLREAHGVAHGVNLLIARAKIAQMIEIHAQLTKLCASVQDSRKEDKGQ